MERLITSVRRRFLTRRAAPWFAWLGLFAGGAWTVQHYRPTSAEATNPPVVDSQAKHQIKQLFRAHTAATPSEPAEPPTIESRYGSTRYVDSPTIAEDTVGGAQQMKPASTDSPAPVAAAYRSDQAAAADPSDGNPSGDAPLASTEPDQVAGPSTLESSAPAAAELATPEVARGQEPDGANPLRQASYEVEAATLPNEQARSAFADAPQQPEVVQVGAARNGQDDRLAALNSARPLPTPNGRYGSGPSAPPTAQPPAPAFANEPRAASVQAAAPAAEIPNPMREQTRAPSYADPSYAADAANPFDGNHQQEPAVTRRPAPAVSAITPTPGLTSAVGGGRPGERLLEGPQSPAITVHKLAPPEIQVGKKCTFAIRVKNNGQRTAQQVIIRDEVPMGTELVGTAPRASVSGGQVQWDLGTLSAGEERIVEMELLPTDEGELGSVATVTFAAHASAKARCTKPELEMRLASKPRVMVGQQHLVQIEISNPGSGDATNVMLLQSLPEGVSHEAGAALEFEVGTLRAGETRKLDLVLNAEQAGIIDNTMTARADANLQAAASVQFEIIAPALALTVDGPKRKYLERPATFVVRVDNPGTASAQDVQLVAELPKGLQYVNANNLGEYDQATHSVYWSLAELPANEQGVVEVTALPIAPGEHTIRAATKARQGLEDRAERSLSVEGMAALTFETRALENLIEIGGETVIEIRVTNRGSKAASNVQVAVLMPPGLQAVDAKGDSQHAVQGNQVNFAPVVQLAPGAEAIFHVTARGEAPGDQRAKVRVTSQDEQPITKEASARVYSDQ